MGGQGARPGNFEFDDFTFTVSCLGCSQSLNLTWRDHNDVYVLYVHLDLRLTQ